MLFKSQTRSDRLRSNVSRHDDIWTKRTDAKGKKSEKIVDCAFPPFLFGSKRIGEMFHEARGGKRGGTVYVMTNGAVV